MQTVHECVNIQCSCVVASHVLQRVVHMAWLVYAGLNDAHEHGHGSVCVCVGEDRMVHIVWMYDQIHVHIYFTTRHIHGTLHAAHVQHLHSSLSMSPMSACVTHGPNHIHVAKCQSVNTKIITCALYLSNCHAHNVAFSLPLHSLLS